ncbi:MAG: cytidylate kinase family protein [Clostridia bacterium]
MQKKHIITMSGNIASGKGTVIELLKKSLNYGVYRNGAYARSLCHNMGITINEFQEYIKVHPEIDNQIEKSAREYAKNNDDLIIDARLGWYVVKESFKVYLSVNLDVAATRIMNDKRRLESESYSTFEEAKKYISYRQDEEEKRFKNLYGIDINDMTNYDYVLDTTNLVPSKINELIMENYMKWLEE